MQDGISSLGGSRAAPTIIAAQLLLKHGDAIIAERLLLKRSGAIIAETRRCELKHSGAIIAGTEPYNRAANGCTITVHCKRN